MRRLFFFSIAALLCGALGVSAATGIVFGREVTLPQHHQRRDADRARRGARPTGWVFLFGAATVEPATHGYRAGSGHAFAFRDQTSGTAAAITLYIAPRNRAHKLVLGIYSDAGGRPGSRLAAGSMPHPRAGAWNTIEIADTPVQAGATYWIAVLGKGGRLYLREARGASCHGPGAHAHCAASIYVSGTPYSGTGTPPPGGPAGPAPGGPGPTGPPSPGLPLAPSNTALPTISGIAQQGQPLSTTNGSWKNRPTSYSYAWEACDSGGNNCSTITGASLSTYTLQLSDVNHTIRVIVTAANAGGSIPAASAPTSLVTGPPPAGPVSFAQSNAANATGAPLSLSYTSNVAAGDLLVGVFRTPAGSTPSVSDNVNGAWTRAPLSNTYASIFYLADAKSGPTTVTATDSLGTGPVRGSIAEYAGVAPADPFDSGSCTSNSGNPSMTGSTTPIAAGELVFAGLASSDSGATVSAGSSNGVAATLRDQLSNANGTIAAEDVVNAAAGAQAASFMLTGSGTDFGDDCVAAFVPEATAPPGITSLPSITGTAQQGNALLASRGTWTNYPTSYGHQWQRDGSDIGGATNSVYVPQASDVGHTLDVVVTASNSRGSLMATSAPTTAVTASPPPPPPGSGLHVSGSQLLDANKNVVHLHGVDRGGTEYACAQGWGIFDGSNVTDDGAVINAISTWKGVNSVFYGLNEDCWLGINGVPAAYSGQNYINAIKTAVTEAAAKGLYVVIGYFWGDGGTTLATSQPPMPDNDHTPLFWQQVANTFKGDPNVIFRLQEEPHPYNGDSLSGWQCWSQGDVQYDASNTLVPVSKTNACAGQTSFTDGAVGMQSLINIIRGTGATNVIQVPGNLWAGEVQCNASTTVSPATCGFLDSTDGVEVHDTLTQPQLMADLDIYMENDGPNVNQTAWTNELAPVTQVMPLDAGELGEDVNLQSTNMTPVTNFLNWADSNGASYYAWAWDSWSYPDVLVSNDETGAALSPWGTLYQSHVAGL